MEYWVDNARENEAGSDIGVGSEADPFNSIRMVEDIITPLSSHDINLIGTNKPYQGGLGGFALRSWIFENCTVTYHETDTKKVLFVSSRSIPVAVLDGTLPIKTKIFKKFKMKNRRFFLDGDQLVLVRPVYLKGKANAGFKYEKDKNKITLDVDKLPKKEDVVERKATLDKIK